MAVPNLAAAINVGMKLGLHRIRHPAAWRRRLAANAIEVLHRAIRAHPHVDFFHSSRRSYRRRGQLLRSVRASRKSVFEGKDFLIRLSSQALALLAAEMALAMGGVDEAFATPGPDDYDFPWTMFEHGARFQALPECLYFYRDHCDGFRITTHDPRTVQLLGVRRILRKHGGVGFWRSWMMCTPSGGRAGEPVNLRQPLEPVVLPPCRVRRRKVVAAVDLSLSLRKH